MPPKKAPAKAPVKAAAKAPVKTAAKAPVKAAAKAAAKRGRGADASVSAPATKKAKVESSSSTTAAASGGVRPPVDEHCTVSGLVYMEGPIPWAVKLNQAEVMKNNNKFYIIQLVEMAGSQYACFTRWGRVGEPGQKAVVTGNLATAQKAFEGKFKDKTKNDWNKVKASPASFVKTPGKYDLVETDVSATPAAAVAAVAATNAKGETVRVRPSKLDPRVQGMLGLIMSKDMMRQQMKEKNIDAQRMPLGKLTENQIHRGYEALSEIEKILKKAKRTAKDTEALAALTSKFYTIIPHDFGRNRPPVIDTMEMIKEKYDLLNMLNDIQIAVALDEAATATKTEENPLDKQYKELGCTLEPVDPKSAEYQQIDTFTKSTQGYRKCSVRNAFRVDRPDDKTRMQKHAKEGGRYLLWHGTNVAVVAAILKTGLRIMPHSGGRVGRGLYFASENGKSSAYVGCSGKTGYMFLVEVCMGDKVHRITNDDSSLCYDKVQALKASSVLACGRQEPDPAKSVHVKGEWGDIEMPQSQAVPQPQYAKSSFSQSEYLIYEESRARIKYVLEMNF